YYNREVGRCAVQVRPTVPGVSREERVGGIAVTPAIRMGGHDGGCCAGALPRRSVSTQAGGRWKSVPVAELPGNLRRGGRERRQSNGGRACHPGCAQPGAGTLGRPRAAAQGGWSLLREDPGGDQAF